MSISGVESAAGISVVQKAQQSSVASGFANMLAQSLAAAPAAKETAGVPEGFEEMAERNSQLKREVEEIMARAREVSGFMGPIAQSAGDTLYGVGPYTSYDSETETWRWHNEDGTLRDTPPSEEETLEQIRVSAEKREMHKQYLIDNGVYEKMAQLSRDETALEYAAHSERFRNEYLADPEGAVERGSILLNSRSSQYGYREASASDAGVWYGAPPLLEFREIPSELRRIDLSELMRAPAPVLSRLANPMQI